MFNMGTKYKRRAKSTLTNKRTADHLPAEAHASISGLFNLDSDVTRRGDGNLNVQQTSTIKANTLPVHRMNDLVAVSRELQAHKSRCSCTLGTFLTQDDL